MLNTTDNHLQNDSFQMQQNQKNTPKNNTAIIIAAVLGLVVFAIVFTVAIKFVTGGFQNSRSSSRETKRFSFGTVENNTYKNDWAEIKLDLNEQWAEASEEAYERQQNSFEKIGFCVVNQENAMITFAFSDIAEESGKYLDEELKNQFFERYASELENAVFSEHSQVLKGLTEYESADITGTLAEKEICKSVYIRKKDNYFIIIKIQSNSASNNHQLFDLIQYNDSAVANTNS